MDTRSLRGGKQADWLEDPRVEAVLHSMHTVAFQIDTDTGRQTCSPTVKEQLALGNDGKSILETIREHGLVYAADEERYDRFCRSAAAGGGSHGDRPPASGGRQVPLVQDHADAPEQCPARHDHGR